MKFGKKRVEIKKKKHSLMRGKETRGWKGGEGEGERGLEGQEGLCQHLPLGSRCNPTHVVKEGDRDVRTSLGETHEGSRPGFGERNGRGRAGLLYRAAAGTDGLLCAANNNL